MKATLGSLQKRRVLVFGLGGFGGGVGTVRWLLRHGAQVVVSDQRPAQELRSSLAALTGLQFERRLGKQSVRDLKNIDLVIVNPGVPRDHVVLKEAKRRGIVVANIASLLFMTQQLPIIGVTGTRGKSSTANIIAALLRAARQRVALVGQPGVSLLDTPTRRADVLVAELSSWQLEGLPAVQRSPATAVITNFSADHLNRYRSLQHYASAKQQILRFQTTADHAVLPFDDVNVRRWARLTPGHVHFFSATRVPTDGVGVRAGWLMERRGRRGRRLLPTVDLPWQSEHMLANVAAALAAVIPFKLSSNTIRAAFKNVPVLGGRQEVVSHALERLWVNDTTATSPAGVRAALQALPKPITLIAGGQDKHVPLKPLAKLMAQHTQALILLPGTASDQLWRFLPKQFRPAVVRVASMRAAVTAALSRSQPGSTVVLSPGAASFNLFHHEFDRGEQFTSEVKKLAQHNYAQKR